jgi:catechol 2,3-dioxygenase-like lactoylglutathione lyase family enzyme/SAM-dependent methyltransferase
MTTETIAATTKFQIALHVADLPRSLRFYRFLLNSEPVTTTPTSARIETEKPPLVLTLTQGEARKPGSTLNHLGFRLPDQVALVDLQRRLEEGGIATQRQEGVECCYALQTKFWVTDPDKHLWELYIVHEDLDHSGFDDPAHTHPWKAKAEPKVWTHPLTDPIPARLNFADGSLDEVHLEGTFNARMDDTVKTQLLAEIFRVLRPGGTVAIHGMAGDRPFPGVPAFPGIAALVKHVPTHTELTDALHKAGFVNSFLEKFDGICLSVPGMELREIRLLGTRPDSVGLDSVHEVLYRGPFDEVTDDNGVCYRRGERVSVNALTYASLREGSAADQFVFLP